jgi:uncharacterized membrane protein YhaH (DUF805 family)
MNNETLVAYITTERARGVTDDAIKGALLEQGWKWEDVAIALGIAIPTQPSARRTLSLAYLFEGRLGRWQYFTTGFFLNILIAALRFLLESNDMLVLQLIVGLCILSLIPFSFSLLIRRVHDLGWSGWSSLFGIIPIVNIIFVLIILFKKGNDGANAYGAPQVDRSFEKTLLNL